MDDFVARMLKMKKKTYREFQSESSRIEQRTILIRTARKCGVEKIKLEQKFWYKLNSPSK
jgi:hypothetical protein